ncbi:MAG: hypothetical protein K2Z80_27600 [Xanthobacteraceae bacterium]|nr:hypothetical protein [Xanthobacteraceae bacterium]
MAKVIVKNLSKSLAAAGRRSLPEKRVVNAEGKVVKIPMIDSDSPHFSADLLRVFRKNVAKARRENKQRFGSPDRVGQKA